MEITHSHRNILRCASLPKQLFVGILLTAALSNAILFTGSFNRFIVDMRGWWVGLASSPGSPSPHTNVIHVTFEPQKCGG